MDEREALRAAANRYRVQRDESERIWTALDQRWGTRGGTYWYPLMQGEMPSDVVAFQAAWFHHAVSDERLIRLLRVHGVARLWELDELGWVQEIAVELIYPHYVFPESYWTAGDLDWLTYASHEDSITVAGEWLVEAVKTIWPQWEQHLWMGWEYQRPPQDPAEGSIHEPG